MPFPTADSFRIADDAKVRPQEQRRRIAETERLEHLHRMQERVRDHLHRHLGVEPKFRHPRFAADVGFRNAFEGNSEGVELLLLDAEPDRHRMAARGDEVFVTFD